MDDRDRDRLIQAALENAKAVSALACAADPAAAAAPGARQCIGVHSATGLPITVAQYGSGRMRATIGKGRRGTTFSEISSLHPTVHP